VSLRQDADAVDAPTNGGSSTVAPRNRLPFLGGWVVLLRGGVCFFLGGFPGFSSRGWPFASRVSCGYFIDPGPHPLKTP